MKLILRLLICFFSLYGVCQARAGQFETLGIPVKSALIMGAAVGVDEKDNEVIYFNCAQPGNTLFLLQVNPKTGKIRQFDAPIGQGAWALLVAPNKCVYLGTWESGYLLKFDPRQPDKGLESLGKPSATETYLWQFAIGKDERLYSCTYPQAKLVRHDFKTGQSEDLGRLDDSEMYARNLAASTNGLIYIGIGTVRAQVVQFDPATGEKKSLIENEKRPAGQAMVHHGTDGAVYVRIGGDHFRCDKDKLTPVETMSPKHDVVLSDGRVISDNWKVIDEKIVYTLKPKNGKPVTEKAAFNGKGLHIFAIGAGPDGQIYGSTVLPLEVFDFTPKTKALRHLGNSTGAEVYSFATDGKLLYSCSYPGSYLAIYDPQKPWNFGTARENNPRGIGRLGDGHLRPRAMVIGTDGRVYIGSLPPYGQTGGALGIYDPNADKVVENYRHLIQDQGISALCAESETGKIFGGSTIEAGGGRKPEAKECVAFAWNPKTKQKEWESVIVAGDKNIAALTVAHGKVFGVSRPSQTLFVIDPKTFAVLHKSKVGLGSVHEVSMAYYAPHDCIYGLAKDSIFKVDPKTLEVTEVARSSEPINCGFAVTDTGIYFGSKTKLVRWKWDEK